MVGAPWTDRLKDSRALVTGGAKGIGAAIVRRLAAERAEVHFCDRDAEAGRALAAETGARFTALDVTDHDAVRLLAGGPGWDVLVSNAGIDQHAFFTATDREEWRRLYAVNLESCFSFCHAVLPGMQQRGYGRIVLISSEAGRGGSRGGAVYAATKAALIGFGKSLARENARFGVTVNTVAPGPVRTPLLEGAVEAGGDRLLAAMTAATLVGRLGEPEEVAAAVAFLASREAGFVTGETLGVSGGMGI